MMFSLTGKTALITGGATGIGQALADAMADAGADVAITVHSQSGQTTRDLVTGHGRKFHEVNVDLANLGDADDLADSVERSIGAVDILINNAGIIRRNDVVKFSDSDWSDVISVNLDAVWHLSRAFSARMVQRGGGKIINIASMLSFQGGTRVPSYAASKHAVVGLTKAMANDLSAQCVNVNCIAPGYIATSNTAPLQADPVRSKQILDRIPAGRWGRPSDLGGAAVFLASAASEYVHGQVVAVDGGWLAR